MIKIVKNPNEEWMRNTELEGQKYLFRADDLGDEPRYGKIGLKTLFGYYIASIMIIK